MSLARIAVAFGLLVLAAPGALADDGQGQAQVTVTLENLPDGGATYTVEGAIPFLPKGASLDVSLIVEGRMPIVEAVLFSIQVHENGRFRGVHPFEAPRVLAPLVYQTRVILQMPNQTQEVRMTLARELGYTSEYVGVLATRSTPIGTPEEQAAFARTSLERCLEYLDRLDAQLARLGAALATPAAQQPEWAALQEKFILDSRALRADLRTLKDSKVVWGEALVLDQLSAIALSLASGVGDHARARPAQKHHDSARAALMRVRADVEGRLPGGRDRKPR